MSDAGPDTSTGGTSGSGGASGTGGSGGTAGDASGACPWPCGDGVCIDGACCDRARACGDECCADDAVCSFGVCQTIGAVCTDGDDCEQGEYCEPSLAEPVDGGTAGGGGSCVGGEPVPQGRCLPRPPLCPPGTEPDPASGEIECVASCTFEPPTDPFDIELKYEWGAYGGETAPPYPGDVRNAPIVIQLDDDDCDGKVTSRDIPEIVFTVSPEDQAEPKLGDVRAISIIEGQVQEKWVLPGKGHPWTYLAAGNIDGAPGNEVVVCDPDRRVVAYSVDPTSGGAPTELWASPVLSAGCGMPSIADLKGDGSVEVVVRGGILSGTTGQVIATWKDDQGNDVGSGGYVIVSDVDDDGDLDVVSPSRAFDADGVLIADAGVSGTHAAIADLSDPPDGVPEVVSVHNGTRTLTVWRYAQGEPGNAEVVRGGVDINEPLDDDACPVGSSGHDSGGGPPTIADVNGDGIPDVAVAGGVGYAVFDGKKLIDASASSADTFFWAAPTKDCSSAQTGSSVFDFNGDGKAEVLYGDEERFYVFEGLTGTPLFTTCNTNGTILELPVVADVDNDGQADIVVASNARYFSCNGTKTSGIRVLGSKNGGWVRTRRVWNQHAYHVTNVGEDGSIPAGEAANWKQPGLNNFRQNKQPGQEFAAPDLVVTLEPTCGESYGVIATVRNLGEAPVGPGATVTLYEGPVGSGTEIGTEETTNTLFPAQAERLLFDLGTTVPGLIAGTSTASATVSPPAGVVECRFGNNESPDTTVACQAPR